MDLHSRCSERKMDSANRHWWNCAAARITLRGARSLRNHGTLPHAAQLPHPKAMPRQGILLGPGIATAQCTMNVFVATGVRHGV